MNKPLSTDPACICQFWSGPPPHPGCSVHGKMPPLSSNSLVAELRKVAKYEPTYRNYCDELPVDYLMEQAAGEIERLTAEWTKIEAQYSDLWRRHCDQRDDYDRLRAALEEIATGRYGDESCIRKAREALAGAPDETKAYPHAPAVPDEYLARVQSVVSQGIAILGRPRGIRAGAEADEWLRNLAGLPQFETSANPIHVCGLQGFGALGDVCPACETTAAHEMRCPVHWTYENGLRIRCKKAMGHTGECDLK